MKKKGKRVFLFALVLTISISLASAGFFEDVFGRMTGNAIGLPPSCIDSDGGINTFNSGNVSWTSWYGHKSVIRDKCKNSSAIVEYSCDATGNRKYLSNIIICEFGCNYQNRIAKCNSAVGSFENYVTDPQANSEYYPPASSEFSQNSELCYCDCSEEDAITSSDSMSNIPDITSNNNPTTPEIIPNEIIIPPTTESSSSANCTDLDGGKDAFKQDSVLAPDKYYPVVKYRDECYNATYVREGYCENGIYKIEKMKCEIGCKSGACLINNKPFCFDSEHSLYEKGFTKTNTNIAGTWDVCKDTEILTESYCNYAQILGQSTGIVDKIGTLTSREYTCPNGCVDGACVYDKSQQICTDSDGGKNIFKKGTINAPIWTDSATKSSVSDSCTTPTSLWELTCTTLNDNGRVVVGASAVGADCPSGYACKNGACILNSTSNYVGYCLDSDNGENYYEGGYINYDYAMSGLYQNVMEYYSGIATAYDACEDNFLTEYYCAKEGNINYVGKTVYPCPKGCTRESSEGHCVA